MQTGFQNRELVVKLAAEIRKATAGLRQSRLIFMEVCGTHTNSFFRFGLNSLLPPQVELLSGPGCPVCVTPNEVIDYAVEYSRRQDVIVATFGDMLKVPGSYSSLLKERAHGAQIKVVYSATEAVRLAEEHPEKKVIFIGIGFETTAPTIAAAVLDAAERGIKNFLLLSALKILPPALEALLNTRELKLDGLLCPGHVSVITGTKIYEPLVRKFLIPCVVAGFEPVDILQGLLRLVLLAKSLRAEVVNEYSRVVKPEGNKRAQTLMQLVFEPCNSRWRGLGVINASGQKLRKEFKEFEALLVYPIQIPPPVEHPECLCGEVLRGVRRPPDCPLFRRVCTPENPVGACMVSFEGNCAIYYKYGIQ
ncbi:MAG: hydrogenase formation protein HypD [Candidatus Sumerlaeia bacterium]|nr:hydrogenase formation protein HypD [Candidatus Sumerlaeia bacterium]